ncbi:hypothetical protein DAPPUDRAFT_119922 [Daphnia pulex]|uniref:Cuticle protein n=1 Tax=Daphnia pulex TaxID=6669 RepID=E9HZU5_DAPPU|nr:hypothetical protein DAPPUDRAFT_119922 [Daphnia pulex]|eukprot:EFX62735.1 hypothetical protein DAPPUDRAFT_119922 [Daphnia pulex]
MKDITVTVGHLAPSYFPAEAHLEHSHTLTGFRKGKTVNRWNYLQHFPKAVVVVLMAFAAVSAQIPAGWNYNPFLYYPFTAQPAPVQETAEVAAARAAHLAAHTSTVGSSRVVTVQPVPVVWGQPTGAILDTPEVWAAKVEHYRAHSAAAAANGVVSTLAPLPVVSWGVPQPVQDTPEVAAASAAHLASHAATRGKRSVQQDTPEVKAATHEHYRAYNAAAAANGIMAYLPARYANMPFGMPQQVQETLEVVAARAHLAAHAHAAARVAEVAVPVQPLPSAVVVASPQPVQDTPEVHAAKMAFFRAFHEAAVQSG